MNLTDGLLTPLQSRFKSKRKCGRRDYLQDFVITNNVILYAKWIDLEKGSDGLVFEKVIEPNPEYEIGGDKRIYQLLYSD